MKKKTYKITKEEDEEDILIYEETADEAGNVIHHIDYQTHPSASSSYTLNSDGAILVKIELEGDVELTREKYIYNEKGYLIETNLFIGGELYEQILYEYKLDEAKKVLETIETTFQEGIEISKSIEILEKDLTTTKFYVDGELEQLQIHEHKEGSNTWRKSFYNSDNQLFNVETTDFDRYDNVVEFKLYSGNNQILEEYYYEYERQQHIKKTHNSYLGNGDAYVADYEYDRNGNLTKKAIRSPQGSLLAFNMYSYDRQNRCIEEKGLYNGSFDAMFGYTDGDEYHFRFEYEG